MRYTPSYRSDVIRDTTSRGDIPADFRATRATDKHYGYTWKGQTLTNAHFVPALCTPPMNETTRVQTRRLTDMDRRYLNIGR